MLRRLSLADFRNYLTAELEPAAEGLTVIVGDNGDGKTNLLEAIGYLATLSSFRGAGGEALVRQGSGEAVVRGEVEKRGKVSLVEVAIRPEGRDRVLVDRQPLRRTRDLLGTLRATVFSPDDLRLVKGSPSERRGYLDETLRMLHPRNDALLGEVERVLRQRNALLRQCAGGRPDATLIASLDVWDTRLARAGDELARARRELVEALHPEVVKAYDQLAGTSGEVSAEYQGSWEGPLGVALAEARDQDLRRGVTTVGPHRDELMLLLGADRLGTDRVGTASGGAGRRPARAQASQGEQRCLALALRLATHAVLSEATGSRPVLLLDDVFSELDAARSEALVAHLPSGQALLTTTGGVPAGARPDCTVHVRSGRITGS